MKSKRQKELIARSQSSISNENYNNEASIFNKN
jgi:hypothetical protein